VDSADAPGAELGDFQHSCLCMINREKGDEGEDLWRRFASAWPKR
jgi:hypothetical protein